MKADDIIRAAREQLRTPFCHQGRMPGKALDCAGLFVHVCSALGLPVQDVPAYGRTPYNGFLKACIARQPFLMPIPVAEMEAGDVLLMRFTDEPQHIAIHAGDTVIHSYEKVGRVVEHRFASCWKSRVTDAFRFCV